MLSRGAVDCVRVYMLRPDPAQVEDSRASQPLAGPAVVRSALMLALQEQVQAFVFTYARDSNDVA